MLFNPKINRDLDFKDKFKLWWLNALIGDCFYWHLNNKQHLYIDLQHFGLAFLATCAKPVVYPKHGSNIIHITHLLPYLLPPLHRCCSWSHDVRGSVGSRWDCGLPGCREICASAEGRAWPRTFSLTFTWYVAAGHTSHLSYVSMILSVLQRRMWHNI